MTSELGRSRCRSTVRRGAGAAAAAFAAVPALTILAAALPAQAALPTGEKLVEGSGLVTTSGAQMTIQQNSARMVLDWQSFNIGQDHSVTFVQPGKGAVALNRVVGNTGSKIYGELQANGQLFLVNPNGVLFGKTAQVNVGGLVASTLDIANKDFLEGKYAFQGKGRKVQGGEVDNQGSIRANGGAVALLGGKVSNQGTIAAKRSSVALAAGNQIFLDFTGDGLLKVQVTESALNALVENKKLIEADGGSVVMTGHATDALLQTVVNNTGTIQARTVGVHQGKIQLLGGFNGGKVQVAGKLDASAQGVGDGGSIETSGANVQILSGTQVTTQAANGKTGDWKVGTTDLTIKAGNAPATSSGIGAATLEQSLGMTNVTLQTVASGRKKGDIAVNAPVAWSHNQLTLSAAGSINVNAVMTASGTAALEMNYGGYTTANPTAVKDTDVHMALSASGFTGRVDFMGKDVWGASTNQLKINGDSYTIVTELGSEGSRTGLDLQGIAGKLNGKYALGADIAASATEGWNSGQGFAPVGKNAIEFTGTFDGLGHVIRDLYINRPNEDWVGLFGATENATLRNVGLKEGRVKGGIFVGGLVGNNSSRMGSAAHISHAYSTGVVQGTREVGGLVGNNNAYNGTARISDAYFTGTVQGKANVGGLVGKNIAHYGTASISRAYSTGTVMGTREVGGLVGFNAATDGTASISHAYSTGAVQGEEKVGGLVGSNDAYNGTVSISHAYSTGAVQGTREVGGLVGRNYALSGTASISHAYSTGAVQGTEYVGGLVGKNASMGFASMGIITSTGSTASISDAYSTGAVQGTEHVGGLVGWNSGNIHHASFDLDSTGQANAVGTPRGAGAEIDSKNRYQHASYAGFGDWTETSAGSGIWQAKDTNGVAQWIMFEGSTRPFLASEYSTTIGNAHQLQLMAYKPDASYQLAGNIDARATRVDAGNAKQHSGMWSSSGFVPVGDSAAKFTGSLNGQGHTISGLNIDRPKQHNVGLFGYAENAQLSHLGVEGSVKGFDHVGLLVGKNVANHQGTASIVKVAVSGKVLGLGNSVGGLVGSNRAKNGSSNSISYALAQGAVEGGNYREKALLCGVGVGGLVGKNYAKDHSTVRIDHAAVSGIVTGGGNVGGVVGIQRAHNDSTASIVGADAQGRISGHANVGGLVGVNDQAINSTAYIQNARARTEMGTAVPPVGIEFQEGLGFIPPPSP